MPASDITITPKIFTDTGASLFGAVPYIAFGGTTRDFMVELRGSAPAGTVLELYADHIDPLGLQDSFSVSGNDWSLSTDKLIYRGLRTSAVGLADGPHMLYVRAVTASGETFVLNPVPVTIDTRAELQDVQLVRQDGIAVDAGQPQNSATFHVTGAAEAGSLIGLYDGDRLLSSAYLGNSAALQSFSLASGNLADGSHALALWVWDEYGNRTGRALSLSVDTSAPQVEFNPQTFGVNDATAARRLALSGHAEAGSTLSFFNDGQKIGEIKNAAADWNFTTPTLALGEADLSVSATDAAGNVGQAAHLHALITPYAGTAAAEKIIGSKNADTIVGGGGADTLAGGAGDDRIMVADLGFASIDGGKGNDTLALAGAGLHLDLRTAGARIAGIENFDLAGNGANVLDLDISANYRAGDTSNTSLLIHVDGDADDTLNLFASAGSWTPVAAPAGEAAGAHAFRADYQVDAGPLHFTMSALVVVGNPAVQVNIL